MGNKLLYSNLILYELFSFWFLYLSLGDDCLNEFVSFHHIDHTSLLLGSIKFLPSFFEFGLKEVISLLLLCLGVLFKVITLPFLDDVFSKSTGLLLAQYLFSERFAVFAPSLLGVFRENVANILLIIIVIISWAVVLDEEVKQLFVFLKHIYEFLIFVLSFLDLIIFFH